MVIPIVCALRGCIIATLLSCSSSVLGGDLVGTKCELKARDHEEERPGTEAPPKDDYQAKSERLDGGSVSDQAAKASVQRPCISREQIDRCRSQLKNCPPEERLFRIQEWRDQHGGITNRLIRLIQELREKRVQGELSPVELKRLERLETVAKRFEQSRIKRKISLDGIDSEDSPPTWD